MTIRITIKTADFDTKSGTSKRGQAYSIREQTGFAQLGDEVRKVVISLGRDQAVYSPQVYASMTRLSRRISSDSSSWAVSFSNLSRLRSPSRHAKPRRPKPATAGPHVTRALMRPADAIAVYSDC